MKASQGDGWGSNQASQYEEDDTDCCTASEDDDREGKVETGNVELLISGLVVTGGYDPRQAQPKEDVHAVAPFGQDL